MVKTVDVQNRINFKNIGVIFGLGVIGCISGLQDFNVNFNDIWAFIRSLTVSQAVIPQATLNIADANMVLSSTGTAFNFLALGGFVFGAVLIMSLVMGVLGSCGGRMS